MTAETPEQVTIVECPRDAWQGLPRVIPTETKIEYLRKLIDAGFRHIDAVSFVSPKHVPSMADSEAVMQALTASGLDGTEIIGIVVNDKGMDRALATPGVRTLGYPYSISAYFRRSNANMSLAESRALTAKLRESADAAGRRLVVYISMAFGNPYNEPWGYEIIEDALVWLKDIGVRTVSLADTVGKAEPDQVFALFNVVRNCTEGIELGVHLHSRPENAAEKINAAYEAGCRRFDSALTGLGGCPFAGDELVGNFPTEIVVETLEARGVQSGIPREKIEALLELTQEIRTKYGHATEPRA